jgi:DNA repair protein RecO (recombination protein O)
MNEFKVEGLILKMLPYGEGNHILNVFSKENGLISLFVKKQKKISHFLISPLTHAEFVLRPGKGELYPCEEISPLSSFLKIREKIESFEAAFHILNALTLSQYPHKSGPYLYDLLIRYLHEIPSSPNAQNLATSFLLKTLRHEGIFGLSEVCTTCQTLLGNTCYAYGGESYCFDHSPSHAFALSPEELHSLLFLAFSRILPDISHHIAPLLLHKKVHDLFHLSFHA